MQHLTETKQRTEIQYIKFTKKTTPKSNTVKNINTQYPDNQKFVIFLSMLNVTLE